MVRELCLGLKFSRICGCEFELDFELGNGEVIWVLQVERGVSASVLLLREVVVG